MSLVVRFRRSCPVDGIDERQHARNAVEPVQRWLRQKRLKDRARLRQARRLDHDVVERWDVPALSRVVQPVEGPNQVASNGAAKAAVLENDHRVGTAGEQLVIKSHLAELVDHNNCLRKLRRAQRRVD